MNCTWYLELTDASFGVRISSQDAPVKFGDFESSVWSGVTRGVGDGNSSHVFESYPNFLTCTGRKMDLHKFAPCKNVAYM